MAKHDDINKLALRVEALELIVNRLVKAVNEQAETVEFLRTQHATQTDQSGGRKVRHITTWRLADTTPHPTSWVPTT